MTNKLLIIGHGQHGKDTVAEIVRDLYGLTFLSSSEFAVRRFLFDKLSPKYGYATAEECMADRLNHRKEWFDLISEYNSDEPARLASELLQEADIYVGMRARRELDRCRELNLFDLVIWVDAGKRIPEESGSNELTQDDADVVVKNNGDYESLRYRISKLLNVNSQVVG